MPTDFFFKLTAPTLPASESQKWSREATEEGGRLYGKIAISHPLEAEPLSSDVNSFYLCDFEKFTLSLGSSMQK